MRTTRPAQRNCVRVTNDYTLEILQRSKAVVLGTLSFQVKLQIFRRLGSVGGTALTL